MYFYFPDTPRICVYMYVCMYVRTYVCMYVRTYVRMYVCKYVSADRNLASKQARPHIQAPEGVLCVCWINRLWRSEIRKSMYIVWKTACSTTEGSGACSINYTKKKVCMYICMYVCMQACIYVRMYVCMCVLCVCMYVCMYFYMYVCTYACLWYVSRFVVWVQGRVTRLMCTRMYTRV